MSVLSYLTALSSEAIPSDAEKISIATSISTLNTRLTNDFGVGITQQLRFGSSTRGTLLSRDIDDRSDIDYMVVFRDIDKTTQTYLDRLKKFADKWYSSSDFRQSSPTIVLELNHIKFDLVPAISDPYSSSFQIPAPQSSYLTWIQTDPKRFSEALTQKNQSHASLIKPVIRLVKRWNVRAGRVFESYAIEQAIVNTGFFLVAQNLKSYYFEVMLALNLPWGASQWRKDQLERAKAIIKNAQTLENSNQPSAAEMEIRKLF